MPPIGRVCSLALLVAVFGTPARAQSVTPDSVRALLRSLWGTPNATTMPRLVTARRHAQRWVAAHPDDGAGHAALALAWWNNGTGGYAWNDSARAHAALVGNDAALRADMVGIYRATAIRSDRGALNMATWSDTAAIFARGPTRDEPYLNTPAWYAAQRAQSWLGVAAQAITQAEGEASCSRARDAAPLLARADSLFALVNVADLGNDRAFAMTRDGALPRTRRRLELVTEDACSAAAAQGSGPRAGPGATGSVRQLTPDGSANFRPDIWDSFVVYMTGGVTIRTSNAQWDNPLLTVMDVTTGVTSLLTPDTAVRRATPAIWGPHVAWEDIRSRTRNPLGQAGNFQVYRYDPATRRQLPVAPAPRVSQGGPRISGTRILWGGDDSVFVRDLEGGPVTNLTVGAGCTSLLGNMGISGDRAVWSARCGSDTEVFLYDLATRTTTRLTRDTASQNQPDVSGDRVVWLEYRGGEIAVVMHDLRLGTTTRVTPPGARPTWPRISGDWVVYTDRRETGCRVVDGPCPHVYRYDLATQRETRITDKRAGFGGAMVWGTRIVWWDRPRGGDQVMLYEEPSTIDPVLQRASRATDDAVRSGAIAQAGVADPVRALLRQASQHLREGDRAAASGSVRAAERYVEGRSGISIAAAAAQAIVAALNASLP